MITTTSKFIRPLGSFYTHTPFYRNSLFIILYIAFINVVTSRVGFSTASIPLLIYSIVTIISGFIYPNKIKINKSLLVICVLILSSVAISILYQSTKNAFAYNEFLFFYGPVFLLMLISMDIEFHLLVKRKLLFYITILFWLQLVSIFFDRFIIIFNIPRSFKLVYQLSDNTNDIVLGLFGSPSAASAIFLLTWLLLCHMRKYKIRAALLSSSHFLLMLGLIAAKSGTGYMCYVAVLLYLLCRNGRYIYMLTVVGIASALLLFLHIAKFNIGYVSFLIQYFLNTMTSYFNNFALLPFFFGTGKMITGDFGWLNIIGGGGFLYTMMLMMLLVVSYYKTSSVYLKLIIFVLVLSSWHYTIIFWPFSQVILVITVMLVFYENKLENYSLGGIR